MKEFIKNYPQILTFGVLQIFFSAPGQTFLIGLFIVPITSDLGFSQTTHASIYSAATLLASLLLNPAGRLIDRYPVNKVVESITYFMAIGCLVLALSFNMVTVFIAYFILRLIGQGVFGLTASTLIIKKFNMNRGKAMGIITLGFPLSEAIYPFMTIALLHHLGWRWTYILFALSFILIMRPLQLMLIKKSNIKDFHFFPDEEYFNNQQLRGHPEERTILEPIKNFTLSEVVRDIKFYLLLIANCLPPLIVTGLFYHQQSLFEANSWPFHLAASGLFAYAVFKAAGSLWMGSVVDRFGALIPFIAMIFMLGLGALIAGIGGSVWNIYLFFVVIGAALGFSSPVMNVVWPQFYGTKHMGSIKGFIATFRNGLTALGPLPIAMALDHDVSIKTVIIITALITMLMACLPIVIWRLKR